VASVDRLTLVEMIEAQKAKLSSEALKLWEELDTSWYMRSEEATFLKRHEVELIDRMDRLPEKDRRIQHVLTELRSGLYQSDFSERRGEPSQAHRDKCVIEASLIKDGDERGEENPMTVADRPVMSATHGCRKIGGRYPNRQCR
jgi:hypothetical protein